MPICLQDPNDLIELYNAALEKLRELFFDESLVQYSSGAKEFRKYLNYDVQQEQRGYQIAPEYWSHMEYYDCVEQVRVLFERIVDIAQLMLLS